jgi:signal transduction histidine kinase
MTKEMDRISNKDYNIKLKEGNDEIGIVAKKFNEMSKKIEENENELLQYIESKQMFIDNLAHEMNTPLTSIKGYAEALEKFDLSEDKRVKYLTYIQSESDRILDMYKKLLFLSYKSNVDFELDKVSIDKVMNIIISREYGEKNYIHKKNDITKKYINMIEAFECDFALARDGERDLRHLQQGIKDKDTSLMRDIRLLEELSFNLDIGDFLHPSLAQHKHVVKDYFGNFSTFIPWLKGEEISAVIIGKDARRATFSLKDDLICDFCIN